MENERNAKRTRTHANGPSAPLPAARNLPHEVWGHVARGLDMADRARLAEVARESRKGALPPGGPKQLVQAIMDATRAMGEVFPNVMLELVGQDSTQLRLWMDGSGTMRLGPWGWNHHTWEPVGSPNELFALIKRLRPGGALWAKMFPRADMPPMFIVHPNVPSKLSKIPSSPGVATSNAPPQMCTLAAQSVPEGARQTLKSWGVTRLFFRPGMLVRRL
jgi:hypothetical protein